MGTTNIFLAAVVALLIAFDVYAAARWGYTGTISYNLLTDASKRPVIALAIGVVFGHLFWPQGD